VVVGDSIAVNSADDCPGCTGFVVRYAQQIEQDTGHPVKVTNLAQHNGLQIDGLLDEMLTDKNRRDALAGADIVVVGIAHNDAPWGSNTDLCDGPSAELDWSKFTPRCLAASTAALQPKLETILATIVDLRAGKPTILRTLNRYNDWIGDAGISATANKTSRDVVRAYNSMQCKAATAHGFTCADLSLAFNGKDGLKPSGDLLAKDFTHPSDKGNEVIASVLADLGYAPLAP
jgi:lysophospholipase L1-like esterase